MWKAEEKYKMRHPKLFGSKDFAGPLETVVFPQLFHQQNSSS